MRDPRFMGSLVRYVFALLLSVSLAVTLLGCGVEEYIDAPESSSGSSNPKSDDIAAAALAPKPVRTRETIGAGVYCPGSFATFKKIVNNSSLAPGPGNEWHHIVNQNPTNRKRFGNRLHCTDNLISLPRGIHRQVTSHYNRKPTWTKGEFVRDVINKRDWGAQYEYGLQTLRDQGVTP